MKAEEDKEISYTTRALLRGITSSQYNKIVERFKTLEKYPKGWKLSKRYAFLGDVVLHLKCKHVNALYALEYDAKTHALVVANIIDQRTREQMSEARWNSLFDWLDCTLMDHLLVRDRTKLRRAIDAACVYCNALDLASPLLDRAIHFNVPLQEILGRNLKSLIDVLVINKK